MVPGFPGLSRVILWVDGFGGVALFGYQWKVLGFRGMGWIELGVYSVSVNVRPSLKITRISAHASHS